MSDPEAVRRAGRACAAGASILAIGGFATQVVQASTTVSDQAWSYPWSPDTSILISLLWAVGQALLVVGVLGLRRSGAAGTTPAAHAGLVTAVAGTAMLLVGHLASLAVSHQSVDDTGPQIVGAVFGIGAALSAIGLLLAGRATLRAGVWHGWRRFTPLAAGVWVVALLGLQFTAGLPSAVAVYALCFLALGIALSAEAAPAAGRSLTQAQGA